MPQELKVLTNSELVSERRKRTTSITGAGEENLMDVQNAAWPGRLWKGRFSKRGMAVVIQGFLRSWATIPGMHTEQN